MKVFFLRKKDEAKHEFRKYKAAVQNRLEKNIKIFCTDNDLKYFGE